MEVESSIAPPTDGANTNTTAQPTDRDVVFGTEGKTNLLLDDLIRLHRILWFLQEEEPPTKPEDIQDITNHILKILKEGKEFELVGLCDVPRPFLKSTGRFFTWDGETTNYSPVSDEDAANVLSSRILEDFTKNDLGNLTEAPFKDLKAWMQKRSSTSVVDSDLTPEGNDALLIRCSDSSGDKVYEQQYGNKTMFNAVSQIVTVHHCDPEKRVVAALNLMKTMDDTAPDSSHRKLLTTSSTCRFLVRKQEVDMSISWDVMEPSAAAEFCLTFVFEVFLEKELHLVQLGAASNPTPSKEDEGVQPSASPVGEPTDVDVLFGRGGLTNTHPGNKRFRDIIALHRPDYIRATKMEKPAVARRIVRSVRVGPPSGRFIKKGEDGFWYDVGDRAAAEKTSQGLRERSNAEKRQRSALREALRIRKQDLVEEDTETPRKKPRLGDTIANLSLSMTPTLNYIGTNLPVPLSLSMKDSSTPKVAPQKSHNPVEINFPSMEVSTAGFPPNATDSEGNIIPTDYDILCGRGGLTNHHKGNKRFRDIVALHRADYVRAPKIQKPSVARVIVRAIRNGDPPGRFLRKDEKTGLWMDVGDKKASEKTSQALREKTTEERERSKSSPLLPNPNVYLTPGLLSGAAAAVNAATAASVEAAGVAAATVDAAGVPQAKLGVPGVIPAPTVTTETEEIAAKAAATTELLEAEKTVASALQADDDGDNTENDDNDEGEPSMSGEEEKEVSEANNDEGKETDAGEANNDEGKEIDVGETNNDEGKEIDVGEANNDEGKEIDVGEAMKTDDLLDMNM